MSLDSKEKDKLNMSLGVPTKASSASPMPKAISDEFLPKSPRKDKSDEITSNRPSGLQSTQAVRIKTSLKSSDSGSSFMTPSSSSSCSIGNHRSNDFNSNSGVLSESGSNSSFDVQASPRSPGRQSDHPNGVQRQAVSAASSPPSLHIPFGISNFSSMKPTSPRLMFGGASSGSSSPRITVSPRPSSPHSPRPHLSTISESPSSSNSSISPRKRFASINYQSRSKKSERRKSIGLEIPSSSIVTSFFVGGKSTSGDLKTENSSAGLNSHATKCMDEAIPEIAENSFRSLRRWHSECFYASWEYNNLEADFSLPNGLHISAHYELIQSRRIKEGRRKVMRDDRKTSGFLLLPESTAAILASLDIQANDVVYDESKFNDKDHIVIAGTASKLFSLLADHKTQDKEYIDTYLATHLRFISTEALITQLLEHFRKPLASIESKQIVLTAAEAAEFSTLIQVRIVNIFKKWLRYHYAYEFSDPNLATQIENFVDELCKCKTPEHKQWGAFLKIAWEKREFTNFDAFEFDESEAPKVILPGPTIASNLSFLDIHPTELARQMTLTHQSMFKKVRNNHLLEALKTKDETEAQKTNPVFQISSFSTKITNWVVYEIGSTLTVKKRAQVLSNFIKLCFALKTFSNYHGALDIYLSLSGFLIGKLRKTWKSIDSSIKDKYKQLTELFDPTGGWKNLRKKIKDSPAPLIIPPNIWLHDLILVDENDDYWSPNEESEQSSTLSTSSSSSSLAAPASQASPHNSAPGERLINFQKLRLFSNIFAEVYRCQLEPFNFHPIQVLQDYLEKHLPNTTTDELEAMINIVFATQEAKKESLSSLAPGAATVGAAISAKTKISKKPSLASLFRGRVNSASTPSSSK